LASLKQKHCYQKPQYLIHISYKYLCQQNIVFKEKM
jgi:hypothetical protein